MNSLAELRMYVADSFDAAAFSDTDRQRARRALRRGRGVDADADPLGLRRVDGLDVVFPGLRPTAASNLRAPGLVTTAALLSPYISPISPLSLPISRQAG